MRKKVEKAQRPINKPKINWLLKAWDMIVDHYSEILCFIFLFYIENKTNFASLAHLIIDFLIHAWTIFPIQIT